MFFLLTIKPTRVANKSEEWKVSQQSCEILHERSKTSINSSSCYSNHKSLIEIREKGKNKLWYFCRE